MPLDPLPSEIIALSRDEWVNRYLRSYKLRDPEADLRPGTQPYIDAVTIADQLAVLSANARQIGRSIPLSEITGVRLDQLLSELGLPPRFPEVGASNFVTVRTSGGGATIFSGDEIIEPNLGLRYQCIATKLYQNGDPVPIVGISTGPATNLPAGTVLVWSNPRPGCVPNASVTEQSDGTGLTGGRLAETDDEARQRISDAKANPAAAGNDAEYQRLAEYSAGHTVAVQKAFTYPAILGPGTIGVAFTLRPTSPGATRVPSSAQMQLVHDYVVGKLPGDDQYLQILLSSQAVNIVLDVQWDAGSAGWADAVPWPARYPTSGGALIVSTGTSASQFVLVTDNASYVGVTPPVAGNTVAFYDKSAGVFRRKRLLSVSGSGPYTCVADMTNGASNTTYVPLAGQRVCPWSDSLDGLVKTVRDYFNGIGPGEMRATFFDPGVREKRSPPAPKYWPYTISNRLAADLLDVSGVTDAIVREGLGVSANVGTAGALASLLELGELTAFKL